MAYNFVNPYNFIPLSDKAPDRSETKESKLYSGVIEYSILTKSPLFIPNTSNDDAFKCGVEGHKSYDFFSYDDLSDRKGSVVKEQHVPVIPGSEIRGMIRSNFEILTNSCLSSLDSDTVMQKRVIEVFKAGLLKKNGKQYDLYEAEDCLLRTVSSNDLTDDNWEATSNHFAIKSYIQKDLKEGQKIKFKYVERPINREKKIYAKPLAKEVNAVSSSDEGYIIKGSDGPDMTNNGENPVPKGQKHCCHVLRLKGDKPEYTDVKIDYLTQVLKAYDGRYAEYEDSLRTFINMENDEFFPVYYSAILSGEDEGEDEIVFLSPASITRELYKRKLSELAGAHRSCVEGGELCPACRLFGTVISGKKTFAKASKLRFSDMVYVGNGDCYMNPITLEPLSSPKLNNMEFYLKRPSDDAKFWTYDYYITYDGEIIKNTSGINGRKFYWHNLKKQNTSVEQTKLNITVRPLKSGQRFNGKVYFEDVTADELNKLIYTLNVGESADEIEKRKNGYKLGAAKPLGFGSIAVSVDKTTIRTYKADDKDKSLYIESKAYDEYNTPGFEENIITDFKKMTSFDSVQNENVDYPRREIDGSIFDWFTNNHKAYDKSKEKEIKSPTSDARKFMYFDMYMIPMRPKLARTGKNGRFDTGADSSKKRGRES